MSNNNRRLVLRQVLRSGLICGLVLLSRVGFLADKGASAEETKRDMKVGINILIDALCSTKNIACIKASDMLEVARESNRDTDLHLRNAGLEVAHALVIAAALHEAPLYGGIDLRSFSMSYNPGLTDDGVIALVRVLPHTLTELGFVKCAIGNDGGEALLKFGYEADRLRMICAEGNNFSKAIKTKFALLAQEKQIS